MQSTRLLVTDFFQHPTVQKARDLQKIEMTGPPGTFTMDRIIYQGICIVGDTSSKYSGRCPYLRWLQTYVNSHQKQVQSVVNTLLKAEPNLENICDCVLCVDQVCQSCREVME